MASVLSMTARGADGPRIESGLRVGEVANPFSVRAVTGPFRGQTLCYRCKLGASPVVCVFARRIDDPLVALLKRLDAEVALSQKGLKTLLVLLTDDPAKAVAGLESLAAEYHLAHIPLTLVNNPYGPQDYRISDRADVTILMWRGPTVRVNRAYGRGAMTEADVEDILSDLPEVMKD
jgi:hypothetical protein